MVSWEMQKTRHREISQDLPPFHGFMENAEKPTQGNQPGSAPFQDSMRKHGKEIKGNQTNTKRLPDIRIQRRPGELTRRDAFL